MQFSKEQNLTFDQAVALMFEKLGDSKIMALASAVGTHVMVRNVRPSSFLKTRTSRSAGAACRSRALR